MPHKSIDNTLNITYNYTVHLYKKETRMIGFVEYMMAHPPALVAFLVITYLFVLAMILPPAFKPDRQKGKNIVLTLYSGQRLDLDLATNKEVKISASSEDEFTIGSTGSEIKSEQFNIFTHIGSRSIRSSDSFFLANGDDVALEITAPDEMKSVKFASTGQKVSGIIAAILILSIWSFLGWIMLSLVTS